MVHQLQAHIKSRLDIQHQKDQLGIENGRTIASRHSLTASQNSPPPAPCSPPRGGRSAWQGWLAPCSPPSTLWAAPATRDMNIRSGEKDQGSRAGDDGDDRQGQGDLEGNTTLVEVAAMSVRALLQPPEGVSCGPVPAQPAVKSRWNNRGKQLGGQARK